MVSLMVTATVAVAAVTASKIEISRNIILHRISVTWDTRRKAIPIKMVTTATMTMMVHTIARSHLLPTSKGHMTLKNAYSSSWRNKRIMAAFGAFGSNALIAGRCS
ncbi:hypothetical protein B0O80DRAFT_471789 [Mortierella sp. GBAus27b]|nr:hypothetical protein B0O80DRAFT_471789 [Mortierella sp. GBAus27b]